VVFTIGESASHKRRYEDFNNSICQPLPHFWVRLYLFHYGHPESATRVFLWIGEPGSLEKRCVYHSFSDQDCLVRPSDTFHPHLAQGPGYTASIFPRDVCVLLGDPRRRSSFFDQKNKTLKDGCTLRLAVNSGYHVFTWDRLRTHSNVCPSDFGGCPSGDDRYS
jgi:hypothetical protein